MKYYVLAWLFLLCIGCNSSEKQKNQVNVTVVDAEEKEGMLPSVLSDKIWYELYKENGSYTLPCHQFPERIKATKNHLTAELTEPTDLTVHKVVMKDGGYDIYFKGIDNFYYNFKWIDQAKSIGIWSYMSEGKVDSSLTFITIDKSRLREYHFKKQKCSNDPVIDEETEGGQFGDWKRTCEGITYLSISPKGVSLVVNNNQINIKARMENDLSSPGTYNLKLIKADDLGSGGAHLDWDNFSTDSTVAQLRLTKKSKAVFSWLGFYNKKTGKRDWVDQSDLNIASGNNAIDLQRCAN